MQIQPKLVALIPPQIESQQTNRDTTMSNYATTLGSQRPGGGGAARTPPRWARPSTKSKTDDTFYLPPEAFNNPDFARGLKLFMSPDGKAARLIITHEGDPGDA